MDINSDKNIESIENDELVAEGKSVAKSELVAEGKSVAKSQLVTEGESGTKAESAPEAETVTAQVIEPLSNETITAHTASLWKYKPVPKEEVEPHSEYDVRSIEFSAGKLMGARVRGKKHKHEGTNCDDWFEIDTVDDWALIATADGAGSKVYSRIGARESCKAAVAYMKDSFTKIKEESSDILSGISLPFDNEDFSKSCSALASVVQNSVLTAFSAVEKAFNKRKTDEAYSQKLGRELLFKDFSGTLLVVAVIPVLVNNKKEYLTISCQIGDGMIALIDADAPYEKALKLLGDPDSGSFAGETDFLTSPQMNKIETLMKRTKIGRSAMSCLMVMSDGVADDYYPNNPESLRLYLDILINGVIGDANNQDVNVSKENIQLIKKIPEPKTYPWVNDQSVEVSLQYVNRLMEATGLSLKELWENRDIVNVASMTASIPLLAENNERTEILKIWLDNYVERGSFDDRTLVLLLV